MPIPLPLPTMVPGSDTVEEVVARVAQGRSLSLVLAQARLTDVRALCIGSSPHDLSCLAWVNLSGNELTVVPPGLRHCGRLRRLGAWLCEPLGCAACTSRFTGEQWGHACGLSYRALVRAECS